MKKEEPTMEDKIISLLETSPNNYFFSWQLVKVNTPKGWLGSSADRVARLLAEKGIIEKKHEKNVAMYRLKLKNTLF